MGNYLLSLRVPPPTPDEDERNHPCYYDWSIPKYSPFRQPAAPPMPVDKQQQSAVAAVSQDDIKQSGQAQAGKATFAAANDNKIGHKTLQPTAASATKSSGAKSSSGAGKSATVVASVSQTGAVKSMQPKGTTTTTTTSGSAAVPSGKSAAKNLANKTNSTKEQTGANKSLKGSAASGPVAAKGGKVAIVHAEAGTKMPTTKKLVGDKSGGLARHGTKSSGAAGSAPTTASERGKKSGAP